MNKLKVNRDVVSRLIKNLKQNPERFIMESFFKKDLYDCGTSMCIAGWVIFQEYPDFQNYINAYDDLEVVYGAGTSKIALEKLLISPDNFKIENLVEKLSILFFRSDWFRFMKDSRDSDLWYTLKTEKKKIEFIINKVIPDWIEWVENIDLDNLY
jgi:hypothetical protein